ncbi:DeoR/GlpR family DNA-binding transcription regulator [Halalkalibacillus halophilus]|uniref:DeoR/GlpR family DNA-binding transcription regulator n=1 Tax=Halalkalibacillus halophilus TaxID=392827 RepID=UPI0004230997|nr:DeoR/GlpR family DNA-binding transcription regulator [Halalkalibacillus halophilus]
MPLYSEERKNRILSDIEQHGRASVQDLVETFGVSESTIRRDLNEMEKEKLLKRTHGGAVSNDSVNFEPTMIERVDRFYQEKQKIARKAASYINNGDTILVDAGTTTLPLVEAIKILKELTVVTNSVVHAEALKNSPHIEVVVLGGRLRHETQALVGPITDQALDHLHVDKAFLGTNGIDLSGGLTTPNIIEASTKRKMIDQATEIYVLADNSKFGKVAFAKFGEISDLTGCITDGEVDLSFVEAFHQKNILLDIVSQQEEGR